MLDKQDIQTDDQTPPSTLIPLTEAEWAAFTPKQKWDVVVALRGPDVVGSETIKWFTTSVIRGKMRNVMRVGGTVNNDLNMVVIPLNNISIKLPKHPTVKKEIEIYPGAGEYRTAKIAIQPEPPVTEWQHYLVEMVEALQHQLIWGQSHFFCHVAEAAEILSIPIAHVGEIYNQARLMSERKAAKLFIEEFRNTGSWQREMTRHLAYLERGRY